MIGALSQGQKRCSLVLSTLLLLILTSCGGAKEQPSTTVTTGNANKAVTSIMKLFVRKAENTRPSPMLGLFVTMYMERGVAAGGMAALRGVGVAMRLEVVDRMSLDETFTLLTELGTTLQVDVPELLNRNQNRAVTLNTYMESLNDVAKRSFLRNEQLTAEIEALREKQRTERQALTAVERSINEALREQDYATAGSQQKALSTAKEALDKTEGELDRMQSIQRAFRELLDIAEERVTAINQNREVLIAGLKVIELPGVDDLGILQDPERGSRRRGESIFGPTTQ